MPIDNHRSAAVVERVLGERFEGVLVTDFYAVYGRLDADKQPSAIRQQSLMLVPTAAE